MYQKKQKKQKSPLAKAATKPSKSNSPAQSQPASTATTGSTSKGFDPYTKEFMGPFFNTLEKSAGKEAVAKAISYAKKGKLDTRLH